MHGADQRPHWSDRVDAADWIAKRLAPFATSVVSVVPSGFEAYARLLHPVEEPDHGHRLVRWRDVSQWSGIPLRRDAQFHAIALPAEQPCDPAPWKGQGPDEGRLFIPDANALAESLRAFTTTPEDCAFCLWEGYGFGGVPYTAKGAPPPSSLPDTVPDVVRNGPVVSLPNRNYYLYTGPVEAITAASGIKPGQTANLAWPADHAWYLASEIDLSSTYVAGSLALIERILADERIEVLDASPDDSINVVEDYVDVLAKGAIDELLNTGHATITTSLGRIIASLDRPTRWRKGALRVRYDRKDGSYGSNGTTIHHREDLRRTAEFVLTRAIMQLTEG